jgi:hypothetical protein
VFVPFLNVYSIILIELSTTIILGNLCHFLNLGYRANPVANGSPELNCPDAG